MKIVRGCPNVNEVTPLTILYLTESERACTWLIFLLVAKNTFLFILIHLKNMRMPQCGVILGLYMRGHSFPYINKQRLMLVNL